MKAFEKFLKSRNGMLSLFGTLIILLLIVAYFSGAFGGITGTAGIPTNPHYDMPATDGNYTCLPTCIDNDTKMFVLAGSNQNSMSNTPIKVWIMVPGDQSSFKLGIFDGDTSKGIDNTLHTSANGMFDPNFGNWDDAVNADTTYTLYADPLADGSGNTALVSWKGNDVMLNNAWWETTINRNELAKAPNGHYYYRLEATRDLNGLGGNSFKVRATGYVFTGQNPAWSVGLVGQLATLNDIKIVYPQSNGNLRNLGSQITYDGDWQMYFYIPKDVKEFNIWDGDFDRGSDKDTDDPNTEGKPAWATKFAVDEGVGGTNQNGLGKPNDDNGTYFYRISPAVKYEVLDSKGQPVYINNNPSGTEEWENYVVSLLKSDNPDELITSGAEYMDPGMYNIHITGMDLHNAFWIGVNYPICDPNGGCPPDPWPEGSCPRTIGYWKNNVKKIYIENRTNGVQESKESLDWGLRNVALASKLYRHGINVKAPAPIEDPTPLTPAEANAILQKTNGNSMLDRALQQTLAAFLNQATGKIGDNSQIIINNISSGPFQGTMMEALRFSEGVILDPTKRADAGLLERAKDISDMINNNMLTNTSEPDPLQACTVYNASNTGVVPSDKQPPQHKNMPKAPKPSPEPVTPAPAPVCAAGNTYTVENTTNNPFYSVKFNFASGTEVKEGGYDTFKYTLPADVVTAMTEMQIHVKAATDARDYTLTCDFTNVLGCDPISDDAYSVSFDGATDNGDGTYTLSFTISVLGQHGLSDVAFSLPEGQTAGGLTENYTADVCVAP